MALPHSHATISTDPNKNYVLNAKNPKLRHASQGRVHVNHVENKLNAIPHSLICSKVKRETKFSATSSQASALSGICKSDCQKARGSCPSSVTSRQRRRPNA